LKIVPICLFCMLSAFAQLCPAQSGTSSVPKTNPGRLTVSTPTTLIRLDTGSSRMSRSSQNTRQSLPSASGSAKSLDVRTSRLALFLQSEPLAISLSGDQTAVHEGEVFAGVQGVLLRSAHFGTNEIRASRFGAIYVERSSHKHCYSHPLGKFTISGEVWDFPPTIREGQHRR